MAQIPASQIVPAFNQALVATFKQMPIPTGFLRGFYKTVEVPTKYVNTETQRSFEDIANEVVRGEIGNRNTFGKSTFKTFEPPYFAEYFDITKDDLYDRVFGSSGNIDSSLMAALVNTNADNMQACKFKIERRYEKYCSDILDTGIISTLNGNVDFHRKAESMVNLTGAYWTDNTVDPFATLAAGGKFMRTVGLINDATFDAIFGETAISALFNNSIFKARINQFSNLLDTVTPPQRNADGANYHGTLTCGEYRVRIWTYPQYYHSYNATTGVRTSTSYLNAKKVHMLPSSNPFIMTYAALPQLINSSNPTIVKGAYIMDEKRDEWAMSHDYRVRSAGLPIPVRIDGIYTVQVVA